MIISFLSFCFFNMAKRKMLELSGSQQDEMQQQRDTIAEKIAMCTF